MASLRFYLLSALVCGVLVLGSPADPPTTERPATIDLKTSPSSSITTEATTPEATTTEAAPTDTTPPDTTTSTTTTTTTTTTAAPPTPPPTPAPTPAPPKPIGPPDQGLWPLVRNNVTCIVLQFAAQFNVTYPKQNSSELLHTLVNVPANATVAGGNCTGAEQWITIAWPAADSNNTLTVVFARNDTTKSYKMKNLNVTLEASMFPNITDAATVDLYHGAEWQTPLASSYRCTPPTELNMVSDESKSSTAKLTLSRLQEEAFRTAAGNGFSAARDCAGGDIPDAVPIAVGLALGGMVVVVLIAYLVARRRSAARGYLSM